ncbi:hypothetical protein LCGC14_2778570 [marine sediment metagenome]|uniref:Uncharacterized protein n=1 Tax=marine sediment metagenome TaxID=412755 RepID=A0A0F8YTZ6_9ZZZZ
MDVTQSLEVIDKYRNRLIDECSANGPMDWSPSEQEQRNHLVYMLDRMEEMLDTTLFPVTNWDKFNRWLGFVQGLLWTMGEYTLKEMREHNTRPEKKAE